MFVDMCALHSENIQSVPSSDAWLIFATDSTSRTTVCIIEIPTVM